MSASSGETSTVGPAPRARSSIVATKYTADLPQPVRCTTSARRCSSTSVLDRLVLPVVEGGGRVADEAPQDRQGIVVRGGRHARHPASRRGHRERHQTHPSAAARRTTLDKLHTRQGRPHRFARFGDIMRTSFKLATAAFGAAVLLPLCTSTAFAADGDVNANLTRSR